MTIQEDRTKNAVIFKKTDLDPEQMVLWWDASLNKNYFLTLAIFSVSAAPTSKYIFSE